MELIAGAHNLGEMKQVDRLLQALRLVWPSERGLQSALDFYRTLRLSVAIGFVDTLIAATAIELGVALHTFNTKHYSHIAGLKIIKPYSR